jgi:(E)-4-hydroxy-3-methylbut-2-enyl-diphosphate synthase
MPMTIKQMEAWHAASPLRYARRRTRVVMVGKVAVGGGNPLRIQTMTTTDTQDVAATVAQTLRCVAAGAEIVRITAPSLRDARALGPIRQALNAQGCDVPLVADIHFTPDAAMEAALHVEKVRINPGNFADSKAFRVRDYSDAEYAGELKRLEDKFMPLVLRCQQLGRAMRIGTNHGSLSDRIMNRFGDTPLGMVESAMEYLRVAKRAGYHDIILSMKSSNPKVMVQAYRLLAARMDEEDMDYPFHLGVTEAGEGEDGRIKSAAGIGALLEDGLGDTLRVSLTEEPEAEVPVAFSLAESYPSRPAACQAFPEGGDPLGLGQAWAQSHPLQGWQRSPSQRIALAGLGLGAEEPLRVFCLAPHPAQQAAANLAWLKAWPAAHPNTEARPEVLLLDIDSPAGLAGARELAKSLAGQPMAVVGGFSLEAASQLALGSGLAGVMLRGAAAAPAGVAALAQGLAAEGVALILEMPEGPGQQALEALESRLKAAEGAGASLALCVRSSSASSLIHLARGLHGFQARRGSAHPLLLAYASAEEEGRLVLSGATGLGSLLLDGLGDALLLEGSRDAAALGFNILQATGRRITRTEFISCPSCGRTLFDLQEVTARIKARTGHLTGVKIAIMGCIVNGPGEMADADFGYVGGQPGHINLFVGKQVVKKGIPFGQAEDALVGLIKEHGRWAEPLA